MPVPTVRVDEEVYAYLQGKAVPFVDTPNDVLRRELLGEVEHAKDGSFRVRIGRLSRGLCTPRSAFERPIVQALRELGGRAPAGDVLAAVQADMKNILNAEDAEELPTGGQRWHKNANFARLNLTKRGYLASDSPRGVWELTELGRRDLPY